MRWTEQQDGSEDYRWQREFEKSQGGSWGSWPLKSLVGGIGVRVRRMEDSRRIIVLISRAQWLDQYEAFPNSSRLCGRRRSFCPPLFFGFRSPAVSQQCNDRSDLELSRSKTVDSRVVYLLFRFFVQSLCSTHSWNSTQVKKMMR